MAGGATQRIVKDSRPLFCTLTCSAEDLVVLKAFSGRGQDWVDVERIIVRQTGKLDWTHVRAQLRPLAELKGAPQNRV